MRTERPAHTARAAAPGKVILLGEHAVVYGRHALAAAIDRHVEVRVCGYREQRELYDPAPQFASVGVQRSVPSPALERAAALLGVPTNGLTAMSIADLPCGVGLGSSAALSVALVRALSRYAGRPLGDATVCAHALEIETIFHGHPSGIDNTVATHGGLLAFQRAAGARALVAARPIPLVIALGHAARQTQQTVTALRCRWQARPTFYDRLFDDIGRLVTAAEDAIVTGDLDRLGALMNANHQLLHRLEVSTDELDTLVELALAEGAAGAKLTGGGGGGAVICLCPADPERLQAAFIQHGWRAFVTEIGREQRGTDARNDAEQLEPSNDAPA